MTNYSSSNTDKKNTSSANQDIDIKQILEQYLYYWKWFVVAVIVTLCLAFVYLKFASPQYKVDAKILLEKEDKATGELSGLAELSTLTGGSGQSAFVLDQIDVLKSRRLLRKVIERNNLQNTFYLKDNIKETEVLESDSPIKIVSASLKKGKDIGAFNIEILSSNTFSINEKGGVSLENQQFGKTIQTDLGTLVITPNKDLSKYVGTDVFVVVQSIDRTIDQLQKLVQIFAKYGETILYY